MTNYSTEEVQKATLEYFDNDSLAADVFRSKYALRDTSNADAPFVELTPEDMHRRLANEFVRIENNYPSPLSFEEVFPLLDKFKFIVPQGSPMYGIGNPYATVSLSNCVVVASPKDSMSGIMNTAKELANLYKRRAGVGVDLSTLRPDGSSVSNSAGSSTGAWSFADLYSFVTRMVGQSGRRGALMLTMDIRHPDIEKFITMKMDKTKVTGANISVRLSDDFMKAVEAGEDWVLQWPIDVPVVEAKVVKVVSAQKLWDLITSTAHDNAEPGLLFWDNIVKELPAHNYDQFKTVSTNPCSEIPLSPYDSCRLVSINISSFVVNPFTPAAVFDFDKFKHVVAVAVRLIDDLVDLEIEALTKIINKTEEEDEKQVIAKLRQACIDGRRTGLGTHGLADMFAKLQMKYASHDALQMAEDIYEVFRDTAYLTSCNLAEQRGAFPLYSWAKEKDNAFISRLPVQIKNALKKSGRRNISMLTMAPTGSVSAVSQTSSGIEPVFRNSYTRNKKVNSSDSLSRVDFVDEVGDKWQKYEVNHPNLSLFKSMFPEQDVPSYFVTSDEIDHLARVKLQASIQKYIDHGISSTINLPKTATVADVQNIYMQAWKNGLKGVTVYVDGSRSGVLVESSAVDQKIKDSHAPRRPKELPAVIKNTTVDGKKWTFIVGFLDGKPYEIFGGPAENIELPKHANSGRLVKRKCTKVSKKGRLSCYDLYLDLKDGDELVIRDISVTFSPDNENYGVLTRMVSLSLRHGVPLHYIVEQLGRDTDSGLHSFSKVMSRVFKQYIKDGVLSGEDCVQCGAKYVFSDGCFMCMQCGNSKC